MCGISGIWSARRIEAGDLADSVVAMSSSLRHRGPDDSGYWSDTTAGIALGHTRLSILDLSEAGRQPMVGPSGTTRIVFNGEIYNYLELRDSLSAHGVRFRTATDTEVVLALYEAHGEACIQFLRGMFAFALWDGNCRRLLLARDRLGKKPLYYAASPHGLVFASEIKALRRLGERVNLELNTESLNRYLSHGFVSGPHTIHRGVKQVMPGCMLRASAPDRIVDQRYWQPSRPQKHLGSADEIGQQLEARLINATRLRLRADVPVASFLSGGIDSGLVTAFASKLLNRPCATFTVGFDDGQFDERPLARLVAGRYSTNHHEMTLQPDVTRLLPSIARAYDQPFADPSAFPSFCIAEFVSQQGIKVVLTGDGGDELFGGYRRALAAAWLGRAHATVGGRASAAVAGAALRFLPQPRTHRSAYAFIHRFVRGAASDSIQRLLTWSTDSFTADEREALGLPPYDEGDDDGGIQSYLSDSHAGSPLHDVLSLDLNWMLPYDLLVKMDIATMAHGVEARSPFLDHEVVEWALQLPDEVRVPGLSTKPLLRALARKYLPAEVAAAPKRGFEPPIYRWLTRELLTLRDELLLDRNGLLASMTKRSRLEAFVRRPPTGDRQRWAQQVWILLMLAAWDHFVARDACVPAAGQVAPAC